MNYDQLKEIINQIRKYDLIEVFKNETELKIWLSSLNKKQINNFISLDISTGEIQFPLSMLTNLDMLNCDDYANRVKALSALKNGEGCFHLFDQLLKPNFLHSDNYYQDILMLSKADTARYGLWVLGEDSFINSPYHIEDLKLIVEAKDTNKNNPLDFIVTEALATVAGNADSIKSPYHRADMDLIAKSGSDCLQIVNSYPESSLNNLATNKVSLNDKYHLENMQILSKNTFASEFLYIIMTDPKIIKGKNYRKEVEALANAKSENTARAIYYYIINPSRKYKQDLDFHDDCRIDNNNDPHIESKNSVQGNKTPNYLQNLKELNEIPDRFIMHYVSLLMNEKLINNEFIDYDLNVLKNTKDELIYMDLYRYITNETSLKNPFHQSDIQLLRNTHHNKIRKILLEKVTNEYSLKSENRPFDLNYISNLDIDNIEKEQFNQMNYFLFTPSGIDAKDHQEMLKSLLLGPLLKTSNEVSNYLDTLMQDINNNKESKILSLFKKYEK